MTKSELSQDIANKLTLYVNDKSKRCIRHDSICKYSGKTLGMDTPGCIVGQYFNEEERVLIDRYFADEDGDSGVGALCDAVIEGVTVPKVLKDNTYLFSRFQILHDNDTYWGENGLSDAGKEFLNSVITRHDLYIVHFKDILAK